MNEKRDDLELIELGEVSEVTNATVSGAFLDGGQEEPEIRKVNP